MILTHLALFSFFDGAGTAAAGGAEPERQNRMLIARHVRRRRSRNRGHGKKLSKRVR